MSPRVSYLNVAQANGLEQNARKADGWKKGGSAFFTPVHSVRIGRRGGRALAF